MAGVPHTRVCENKIGSFCSQPYRESKCYSWYPLLPVKWVFSSMILLGSFPVLSMSCGVSVFGSRGLAVGQYVYMEVEDSSLPLLRRVM